MIGERKLEVAGSLSPPDRSDLAMYGSGSNAYRSAHWRGLAHHALIRRGKINKQATHNQPTAAWGAGCWDPARSGMCSTEERR